MKPAPLIAVVGETGSGKSAVALEIAKRYQGEIISADARAVYKGLDLGTVKPSRAEQQAVPHHLLDMVHPDESFTAADFKQAAVQTIEKIGRRGHLPILVGGTGLYIDAVLFDYSFRSKPDVKTRQKLQQLAPKELMLELNKRHIPFEQSDSKNPRRLQRLLETGGQTGIKHPLRPHTLVLGLKLPRAQLRRRLERRIDTLLAAGFVQELEQLLTVYPSDLEAFRATSYKPGIEYLEGKITKRQLKAKFLANDLSLAKRQRTWFKRNRDIVWVETMNQALERVEHFLYSQEQSGTIKPH